MLFKYSGKYVNIYFNMEITFLNSLPFKSSLGTAGFAHFEVPFDPISASPIFGQVQKFFLENLLLARFLCWRDISRDFFF